MVFIIHYVLCMLVYSISEIFSVLLLTLPLLPDRESEEEEDTEQADDEEEQEVE